jgi:outer membrane protein assembly factor BamB
MTTTDVAPQTPRKPLRLWPGVALIVVQWMAWYVVPFFFPSTALKGMLVGVVCMLAIVVWWLAFSRAPWLERLGAIVLIVIALIATKRVVHASIAGGGMGFLLFILAIPVMSLALVAWTVITRRFSTSMRRVAFVPVILLACGVFTLVRTGGLTAELDNDIHWRWTKTPEQIMLAQAGDEATSIPTSAPSTASNSDKDWPGFRGPQRDGVVRGVRIKTDWSTSPPVQVWRSAIGPGWASFAVRGGRFYTQEQRGNDEVVSCYDLATGKPVWRHSDAARFWESNGGAGPRATPTLSNGRVYSLGATGIVNVLEADTGAVVWTRNAVKDTGVKIPGWGIAGSPLVLNDLVVVAASGSLIAYDLATGTPRWSGAPGGSSYSSPQLLTKDGVAQILLLSSTGVHSVAVDDGKLLWEHKWEGTPIVQPAVSTDGDVFISVSDSSGTRRLGVAHGAGGWTAEERWTSEDLNPYFNDFVIHNGYAYGFDYSSLSCIELKEGKGKWKGGRYGHGQLVLLKDQELLLVLSEKGELALVKAAPDQFTELARLPALEGKTWNHPVVVGDMLLIRNDHEMAAYKLPLER